MTIPPELLVFGVSMLPIFELRGAIPLGMLLGMSKEAAFFWAEIGNIIPVFFLLKLLGPISKWLMEHFKFFNRIFTKIFTHTREKHSKTFTKFGPVFLIALTAIPLPGTGAWTGVLITFLFDMPYWRSILLILIGNIIAGILVSFGFGAGLELIKMFQGH